jgi:branched-chain amino acid transport system substrate-binding protein
MKKSASMAWGLIAVAIGATSLLSAGAVQAQDVIKIAAGAPLTGPLAKQGQEVANAVKLAVEEWNQKGGVLGKQIEVMASPPPRRSRPTRP